MKSLPPFQFGPRPPELVGKCSSFPVEIRDKDGDFAFYGEVLNTDPD